MGGERWAGWLQGPGAAPEGSSPALKPKPPCTELLRCPECTLLASGTREPRMSSVRGAHMPPSRKRGDARGARSQGAETSGAWGPRTRRAEGWPRAGCARSGGRRCHITASAAAPSPSLVPGMRRTPARLPGRLIPAAKAEPARRPRPSAPPRPAPRSPGPEPRARPSASPAAVWGAQAPARAPAPRRPRGYLAAPAGPTGSTLRRRSGSGDRDASHSLRCGFRPAPTRPRRPLADGKRRAPIAAGLLRPAHPAAARRRRSVAARVPAALAPPGPGSPWPVQGPCAGRPPGPCFSLGRPVPPLLC